jgi:hypothetical protein
MAASITGYLYRMDWHAELQSVIGSLNDVHERPLIILWPTTLHCLNMEVNFFIFHIAFLFN